MWIVLGFKTEKHTTLAVVASTPGPGHAWLSSYGPPMLIANEFRALNDLPKIKRLADTAHEPPYSVRCVLYYANVKLRSPVDPTIAVSRLSDIAPRAVVDAGTPAVCAAA